jgi:uncharacterized protein YuzE
MNFSKFLLYDQISYDQDIDAMYIKLNSNAVVDTDMEESGLIFDYDKD